MGLPLISTSRPPTWNEPMSRKAMGSAAIAATDVATVSTAARVTPRISDMIAPLVPGILRRFPSRDPSEHAADGHAEPHRIGIIRRRLDPPRPVGLGRRQSLGAAIIEDGVIEGPGTHRRVEVGDGFFQRVGV